MVTRSKGSLSNVHVMVCSVVREYYVWCCGCVVSNVCGEVWAYVLQSSPIDEVMYLCAFCVGGPVSKCGVICIKICNHVHGYLSSEKSVKVWDRKIVSGRGLVQGGEENFTRVSVYFDCKCVRNEVIQEPVGYVVFDGNCSPV